MLISADARDFSTEIAAFDRSLVLLNNQSRGMRPRMPFAGNRQLAAGLVSLCIAAGLPLKYGNGIADCCVP
jgi:hypothetical protein